MDLYIGYIDVIPTGTIRYVNFRPTHRLIDGELIYLSQSERQELLPESDLTNINFYSSDSGYLDKFYYGMYIVFDFELFELEDNYGSSGERNRTGYKFDISKANSQKIKELSDVGYYQVISPEHIYGDFHINSIILIEGKGLYVNQSVLLKVNENLLIGPYLVGFRAEDSQYYINTKLKDREYIVYAIKSKSDSLYKDIYNIGASGYERSLFHRTDDAYDVSIDVVSDTVLLQNFRDSLSNESIKSGMLNFSNIELLIENFKSSLLVGTSIPAEIKEKRLKRIRDLLTNGEHLKNIFDNIAGIVAPLLMKYKDSQQFSEVLEHISADDKFMSKIQSFRIIQDRMAALNSELETLKRKKNILDEEILRKSSYDAIAEIIAEHQDEIDMKKKELAELNLKIKELRKRFDLLEDFSNLEDKLSRLNDAVAYKEKRERELENKIAKIGMRLDTKFEDSTQKVVDFAFDGMLSSKLLKQVSKWENSQSDREYAKIVEKLKTIPVSHKNKNDLIDYICREVSCYRPGYNKNSILNIMICVSQGFLTVFSGEPGTGKTSICNIIAHALGLIKLKKDFENIYEDVDFNRYIPISVERGWTSKRDFIGYYNPLTKTFDKSNRRIYDGFRILDCEARGNFTNLPFMILLDEANLSPMEYYWADFMNICDDHNRYNCINLGEDYQLNIPASLRFTATINSDHTTETLSPRLIDRSWVIVLPQVPGGMACEAEYNDTDTEIITWSSLVEAFGNKDGKITPMNGEAKEIYDKICTAFKQEHAAISPRTDFAIRKYWSTAQEIFESDGYDTDISIIALDFAVAQRILPRINGNGDKYKEFMDYLLSVCKENNLCRSEMILKSIIEKGDSNMRYYQFFN